MDVSMVLTALEETVESVDVHESVADLVSQETTLTEYT